MTIPITRSVLAIAGITAGITMALGVVNPSRAVESPAPLVTGGPPIGLAMTPSFDEEFGEKQIDTGRWNLTYGSRGGQKSVSDRTLSGNGEQEVYFDPKYLALGINPFMINDGILTITAKPLDIVGKNAVYSDIAKSPAFSRMGGKIPDIKYSSGAITTRGVFQQKYGYFEIRAAWSAGKGIWPAFWLLPANGSWPPEIDILEAHGDKPGIAFQSLHSKEAASQTKSAVEVGDQQQFHRYGVLWRPDRLDFYVDGKLTNSISGTRDLNQPMYMIVNLAIGGYWPGRPVFSPDFQAAYKIDYVRAWRFDHNPAALAP